MIDKPFEIGDFIAVGDIKGTVESTGIKTTRIRSLTGEQIIIANSDILDSRVNNFKRMEERRITFTFGVKYQTARENLQAITDIVKNIIENQSNARFDRGHLKGFDASSIDYEFVYWVTNSDYVTYMDVQEKINLAVIDVFSEKKIEMARPTQTVFLQK
jgi:small-conductance mechanosensitive channel